MVPFKKQIFKWFLNGWIILKWFLNGFLNGFLMVFKFKWFLNGF